MDSDLVSIPFWLASHSLGRCVHPMSCQIVTVQPSMNLNWPRSSARSGRKEN